MIKKIASHQSNRCPRKIGNALNVFYKVHANLVKGIAHAKDQQAKNDKKIAALSDHSGQLQEHIYKAAKAVDKIGEFLS